jgi:hypothetical protein
MREKQNDQTPENTETHLNAFANLPRLNGIVW